MVESRLVVSRKGSNVHFFIDGQLQFSTEDEHLYHETLVLPAACLIDKRIKSGWKCLILGGGDGLAARELLTFRNCSSIDLVDYDSKVIEYGRSDFATINHSSLSDPRVKVHIEDARDFCVRTNEKFDIIIVDFTFPQSLNDAGLYTKEFLSCVVSLLQEHGTITLNACSPTKKPYAFLSMGKTIESNGLKACPLQVSIPSFISSGYGDWAFWIASKKLLAVELDNLSFPDTAIYLTAEKIKMSMNVPCLENQTIRSLSRVIEYPGDFIQLLNTPYHDSIQYADPLVSSRLFSQLDKYPAITTTWAEYAMKLLKSIDIKSFISEMEKLVYSLNAELVSRFQSFKKNIQSLIANPSLQLPDLEEFLAGFMILVIFINLAYPDNAFAKGYYGGSGSNSDFEYSFIAPSKPTPFHTPAIQKPLSQIQTNGVTSVRCKDNQGSWTNEQLMYSLGDNLFLTISGKIFYRDSRYSFTLHLSPQVMTLYSEDLETPVELSPDPDLYAQIKGLLPSTRKILSNTISQIEKWLAWSGPEAVLCEQIVRERSELQNLQVLSKVLQEIDKSFSDMSFCRLITFHYSECRLESI